MSVTKVSVTNRSNGFISYVLPDERIRREFYPNETKEISIDELHKVAVQTGGRELLYNFLFINDQKVVREVLNIEEELFDGDLNEIEKVIRNFLSNAIKHTKDEGSIFIEFKDGRFSIENEGNPISEGDMKLIFETYVSKSREGTGLGLALSAKITQTMGGELSFDHSPLGGLRCKLTFPKQMKQ